jgi:hypothetical protein
MESGCEVQAESTGRGAEGSGRLEEFVSDSRDVAGTDDRENGKLELSTSENAVARERLLQFRNELQEVIVAHRAGDAEYEVLPSGCKSPHFPRRWNRAEVDVHPNRH